MKNVAREKSGRILLIHNYCHETYSKNHFELATWNPKEVGKFLSWENFEKLLKPHIGQISKLIKNSDQPHIVTFSTQNSAQKGNSLKLFINLLKINEKFC